jgi:ribonuclease P protein component
LNVLKHNREFQRVYRKGKSAHSPLLVLFYLPDNSTLSVGFTASKKVGNAVRRNRAKRRMRALFNARRDALRPGAYVLVAKAETATEPFEALERAFAKMLERVGAVKL